jgi:4-hydroxyphenylpyruvate dioxygenase
VFPGQGTFDLPAFLNHVITAGYTGPLSLEVFNDVFRQADPRRAAVDGRRSLLALQEAAFGGLPVNGTNARVAGGGGVPALPDLGGFAFAELVVDEADRREVGDTLECLGFAAIGHHKTKPVELWQQGEARILITGSGTGAAVGAMGIETADPSTAAERAQALLAPLLPRTRGPAEADLAAVGAPDGTSVFFCRTGVGDATSWLSDFSGDGVVERSPAQITHIDHVALTQPYDRFDEAALFYRSVLGLQTQRTSEVAAPFGLVRNRAVVDSKRLVRICLSVSVLRRGSEWHPGVTDPQHVAFATADVIATARAARAAGLRILDIPANYYDDLDARLALPSELLETARELGLLYDGGPDGGFLHFYTRVLGGRVFFEVVQRSGGYQGYGETNGPIRMAAHRRDAANRRD